VRWRDFVGHVCVRLITLRFCHFCVIGRLSSWGGGGTPFTGGGQHDIRRCGSRLGGGGQMCVFLERAETIF